MLNETENSIENAPQPATPSQAKRLGNGLVFSIVLISVLAGGFSGYVGANLAAKKNGGLSFQGKTAVSEDSAIVDVVHKDSAAVVSIIISKNLNQIQPDPFSNPFLFDPFFQNRNQPQATPKGSPQFQQTGAGSGFFISSDGLVLTNKHVVEDTEAKYTVLTQDGKKYDAKVLSVDPVNDLALVKVDIHNAPTLIFADSSKIEIGQRVIAIGNSLGQYSNTVTTGIVSGIGRNITAGGAGVSEQLEGVIQTDAAINPGNSGGPLLNIYGQVVGVNTAIDQQGQLVGFAIPANDAKRSVDSYAKNGKIVKPFLGVRYVIITPTVKDQNNLTVDNGAYVISGVDSKGAVSPAVLPGSAADNAGIKEHDILTSVNGQQIDQNNSLASLIKQYNPNDKLTVTILRDKKIITVTIILGESK
jgi:serine protease Do